MSASASATTTFRRTFNQVRRQLAKASGFGFSFGVTAKEMKIAFRKAMIEAGVPATPARIEMVNGWVSRASKLGGAV